jgi:2'-5' RNA ligase
LGIGVGGGELTRLQANVETNLTKLGFSRENRRFEPHLTLGRVRGSTPQDKELARLLALHKDFPAGELKVTEVVVLSSELTPEGPQYDVVGRAPLG